MMKFSQKGIAQFVIIVIALIGLVIGVFLVQNYTNFLPKAANIPSLRFSQTSLKTAPGCDINLDILVDTGGFNSDGADAVINFDPKTISGESIQNGNTYKNYPGNSVNNSTGKIVVSGLASPAKPFNGTGILASLKLKVKSEAADATSYLRFDFDPANPLKTNDSNIIETATIAELLRKVTDTEIVISKNNHCDGTSNPEASPSTAPLPEPKVTVEILPNKSFPIKWQDIPNPKYNDQIEMSYKRSGSEDINPLGSIYAATCSYVPPSENAQIRSSGSCNFGLPTNSGTMSVKYYQNIGTSTSEDFNF